MGIDVGFFGTEHHFFKGSNRQAIFSEVAIGDGEHQREASNMAFFQQILWMDWYWYRSTVGIPILSGLNFDQYLR